MDKVLRDAMRKVERLYEGMFLRSPFAESGTADCIALLAANMELMLISSFTDDLEAREIFQAEHGEYLPKDIYHDLMQMLTKYRITTEDTGDSMSVRDSLRESTK